MEFAPKGMLFQLCQATNFGEIIGGYTVVPRWGGVYVPEVTFGENSDSLQTSSFKRSVLYAVCPWGPKEDTKLEHDRFQVEMRAKMQNVFRMCYRQGHTKLCIGSRFSTLP